jgi:hypothetical protein
MIEFINQKIDQIAIARIKKRNIFIPPPFGMTLSGNAVAVKQKNGSYLVWLSPGADKVYLSYGSQLSYEDGL